MDLNAVTPEELVDGFMIPEEMTVEQKRKADQELALIRQARLAEITEQGKLYGQLLQLKILIQDYLKQDYFEPEKNFAYFLRSYINIQHKKKHAIAYELDIHRSMLSQLLSGNREPSEEILIRLEFHSQHLISAREWLRLSIKQREYGIMTDTLLRDKEEKHLKGYF